MLTYRKNISFGIVAIPADEYSIAHLDAVVREFASDNELDYSTHTFDIVETIATTVHKVPTIIVQFAVIRA